MEDDAGIVRCLRYGSFNEVIRRQQRSVYEFQSGMIRHLTRITRWGLGFEEQWVNDRQPRARIYRLEIREPLSPDSGVELIIDDRA